MLATEIEKINKVKNKITRLGTTILTINKNIYQSIHARHQLVLDEINIPEKTVVRAKISEIDNLIINILALYAPEAKDLREMIASLKATNEIDKLFNQARLFVRESRKIELEIEQEYIAEFILPLQNTVIHAIEDAFSILNSDNKEEVEDLYQSVLLSESQNHDLYKLIEKAMLKCMKKNLELAAEYQQILSITRRLSKMVNRCISIALLFHYAKLGGSFSQYLE